MTPASASNSVGYFRPGNLGGFFGQIQLYRDENKTGSATSKDGNGTGIRPGYASGPFNVAIGLGRTDYAAGDVRQNNIGGQWDFGVAKLMDQYGHDRNETLMARGYQLGTLPPVGAGEIRLAHSHNRADAPGTPESKKLARGLRAQPVYKRTALYTTYARLRNSGGASSALNGAVTAASASSNGYNFGIRHSF